MIEFRDDITEDERLDAQASLDDLCDLCVTNSGCCDCPVAEIKRRIDEVES